MMSMAINNENFDTGMESVDLLGLLDKGIADMEGGRELPLDEAFQKINELRDMRRSERI